MSADENGITFTPEEWAQLVKTDPVVAFVDRVNNTAGTKPYCCEDFRRAQYDALSEEHSRYVMEKYGKPRPPSAESETNNSQELT